MHRILLGLLAVLIVLVVLRASPWDRRTAAVRLDTGQASSTLSLDALDQVLTGLLTQVYTAFGEIDEGAIYDGLAQAVSEDIIADLYLQRRLAQLVEAEEGGKTEIQDVDLIEVTLVDRTDAGYVADARWEVLGVVGHEEHRHERLNAYTARLTVGPAGGEWRLTAFDLDRVVREDVPLFFEGFE